MGQGQEIHARNLMNIFMANVCIARLCTWTSHTLSYCVIDLLFWSYFKSSRVLQRRAFGYRAGFCWLDALPITQQQCQSSSFLLSSFTPNLGIYTYKKFFVATLF